MCHFLPIKLYSGMADLCQKPLIHNAGHEPCSEAGAERTLEGIGAMPSLGDWWEYVLKQYGK
jgi:hypothetical protein